ncbi:hypothetical protein [Zobellella maritima]|uniref:hypothetical protein n=1 Tax=Zobellella maritima TaxID=2059725 RepID=UPI000E308248|nr:hypothetical protein [Zobellella maritima]
MARVTMVELQGINYRWDGQDILVQAGPGRDWRLAGSQLEQVEILDEEGDLSGLFSIDFERQSWSYSGEPGPDDIRLIDDHGDPIALESAVLAHDILNDPAGLFEQDNLNIESVLDVVVTDPLDDLLGEEKPLLALLGDAPEPLPLGDEVINDVISWLDFYSHYE